MIDKNKTTGWQPIETAPQDYDGDLIMVAHFRDHDRLPVYAVMVSWASAMPGTHTALSYRRGLSIVFRLKTRLAGVASTSCRMKS